MASQFDLAPRLSRLQDMGLKIESSYQSTPAQWLTSALDNCDAHVINAKGTRTDDVPVLVKLSWLENMVAAVNRELA